VITLGNQKPISAGKERPKNFSQQLSSSRGTLSGVEAINRQLALPGSSSGPKDNSLQRSNRDYQRSPGKIFTVTS